MDWPSKEVKKFKNNGGYFIDNVPYMDCKTTGEPVRNVGIDAVSVLGYRALLSRLYKMSPETFKVVSKPKHKPTGRPSGWHFMNEFVDKDGTVYHRGKEQPKLKGTLPPTKVVPKKKTKRRTQEEILLARDAEKRAALKKEFKKQKDFLNHKFGES